MSRSLVDRVARALTLVAALAAVGTALLSNTLASRQALAREDDRLRAAARTLLRELAQVGPGDERAEVDEESAEVAPAGIQIALWQRGIRVAGAAGEPPGAAGCETRGARRSCTVNEGGRRVVASSELAPLRASSRTGWLASLAAVLVASLGAYALSRGLSARVVGPLSRLRASVAGLRAEEPDAESICAAEGYDEVDALRGALVDLVTRHARALAAARRFSADAAHELRTPLGTMRAELELAAETEGLPPELSASLARVEATLRRVSALSERLLILATPEGRVAVAREAVSLSEVIEGCVASLDAANAARIELVSCEDDAVCGDAALLRAMVENVIDNALKFSDGAVTASVTREGDAVVLRVRDRGPGLPPEAQTRAFEPFYRSPAARAGDVRGHGVGLALVAHVVRAHGGAQRFEEVERGASLRVSLPSWRPRG